MTTKVNKNAGRIYGYVYDSITNKPITPITIYNFFGKSIIGKILPKVKLSYMDKNNNWYTVGETTVNENGLYEFINPQFIGTAAVEIGRATPGYLGMGISGVAYDYTNPSELRLSDVYMTRTLGGAGHVKWSRNGIEALDVYTLDSKDNMSWNPPTTGITQYFSLPDFVNNYGFVGIWWRVMNRGGLTTTTKLKAKLGYMTERGSYVMTSYAWDLGNCPETPINTGRWWNWRMEKGAFMNTNGWVYQMDGSGYPCFIDICANDIPIVRVWAMTKQTW